MHFFTFFYNNESRPDHNTYTTITRVITFFNTHSGLASNSNAASSNMDSSANATAVGGSSSASAGLLGRHHSSGSTGQNVTNKFREKYKHLILFLQFFHSYKILNPI